MPYVVTGAGVPACNGTYYQTQQTPPIYMMHRNDGSGKKYVLYIGKKYENWYIARADTAIYIRIYYALNPRVDKIKDTFFDSKYHLPDEMRWVEYRLKDKMLDARGRHPPTIGGWRPYIQANKLLNKIEKGIRPPPSVASIKCIKSIKTLRKNNIFWFSTMLRIKKLEESLIFYQKYFGLTVMYSEKRKANDLDNDGNSDVTATYLVTKKQGHTYHNCFSIEAKNDLLSYKGGVLELVFYHKTNKLQTKYINGNDRGTRGFGHIGFNTVNMLDVYDEYKTKIDFAKKAGVGKIERMCLATDPDGYWIKIMSRDPKNKKIFRKKWSSYVRDYPKFNLSQTMLRIKNPLNSLKFYVDILNMKLIREVHLPQWRISFYSLQSESHLIDNPHCQSDYDAMHYTLTRFDPILELCQSHPGDNEFGLIQDTNFKYCNGNEINQKGFGNLGFLVDNLNEVVNALKIFNDLGVKIIVEPNQAKNIGTAFVTDPDGYHIKLLQRSIINGNTDNDDQKTQ